MKILISILLGLSFHSFGEAPKSIVWYKYELPPYHLHLEGEFKDKGIADKYYNELIKELSEFEHSSLYLNIPRMVKEMKRKNVSNKTLSCVVGTFKVAGTKSTRLWSKILFTEPPTLIIMKKDLWIKLDRPKELSVSSLLENEKITFGNLKSRAYYGKIDTEIKKAQGKKNIVNVTSTKATESLLKLLYAKRVDWILGFLPEVSWTIKSNKLDMSEIVTVKVKGHNITTPVYTNCENTPTGSIVIKRVNEFIERKGRSITQESYRSWLIDQNSIDIFNEVQNEKFSY